MFNMIRKTNILKAIPNNYAYIRMYDLRVARLKHISRNGENSAICGSDGRFVPQEVTEHNTPSSVTDKRAKNWCKECIAEYRSIKNPILENASNT